VTGTRRTTIRLTAVGFATVAMTCGLALRGTLGVWPAAALGGLATSAAILLVDARRLRAWLHTSVAGLGIGVLTGGLMALATQWLYPPLSRALPFLDGEVRQLYDVVETPPGPLVMSPVLALVIAAEELTWRGTLMDVLSRRLGPLATVMLASLAYVVPQLGIGSWLLALVAFGCGLIWSTVRHWTGSLVPPTLAHVIWNVVVFILFPLV
jgi:membrane protease YdiL (CAAX protease family)